MITYQDNSKLTYDQWKLLRNDSIGSSEVGAIVYGSTYTSNLEIFYNKVAGGRDSIENIRMWLGKKTQDTSIQCWQFYEGSEQSVVTNSRNGRQVKKAEDRNVTAFNSDYIGRSSSPDAFILPHGIYEGRGEGVLEIKNTQGYVLKSYKAELPTDNILQVCDQMMLLDVGYGELFYFIDNARFEGYPLERKSIRHMEDLIKRVTLPMWQNILKARPLYNQMVNARMKHNMRLAAELEREIARYEPPVQNTTGYLNFLTDRFKDRLNGVGVIKGTDEQLLIAKKHREIGKKITKLEKDRRQLEIELKLMLKENSVLDFGKSGKITWFTTDTNKRILYNKLTI